MFIGHYGVSLAAKRYAPHLPLGVLFLAVQLLDVLFAIFLLAGIEKMRIVPGFTAFNPYDLYWMPYSHSLVGSLGWSALVAGGCFVAARRLPGRARIAAAGILGLAVFSHFALDVPMHTPDLPLAIDARSAKIGLGLWNHRWAAIALELAALVAGGLLYLRASRPTSHGFRIATFAFGAALVVLTLATPFMPDPPSTRAFAFQALGSYALLAILAGLVDRGRRTHDAPRPP